MGGGGKAKWGRVSWDGAVVLRDKFADFGMVAGVQCGGGWRSVVEYDDQFLRIVHALQTKLREDSCDGSRVVVREDAIWAGVHRRPDGDLRHPGGAGESFLGEGLRGHQVARVSCVAVEASSPMPFTESAHYPPTG